MGEGFRANVADACHINVGREDEWVGELEFEGLGVDSVDDGLDGVFGGFLAEEAEDFLTFLAEGSICSCQKLLNRNMQNSLPGLLYLKSGVSFSFSSVINCW